MSYSSVLAVAVGDGRGDCLLLFVVVLLSAFEQLTHCQSTLQRRLSIGEGVVVGFNIAPSPLALLTPGTSSLSALLLCPATKQEVYMSDSHLYMAMDLITGGNLAGGFRCDGEEQAAAIVRQVVRALRYLHDRNIAVNALKHQQKIEVG